MWTNHLIYFFSWGGCKMKELAKDSTHLLPMYPNGVWMHAYVEDIRAFI